MPGALRAQETRLVGQQVAPQSPAASTKASVAERATGVTSVPLVVGEVPFLVREGGDGDGVACGWTVEGVGAERGCPGHGTGR